MNRYSGGIDWFSRLANISGDWSEPVLVPEATEESPLPSADEAVHQGACTSLDEMRRTTGVKVWELPSDGHVPHDEGNNPSCAMSAIDETDLVGPNGPCQIQVIGTQVFQPLSGARATHPDDLDLLS